MYEAMSVASHIASRVAEIPIPKSMIVVGDPLDFVRQRFAEYTDDSLEWGGKLWRTGPPGSYFHVSRDGAEFYESVYSDHEPEEYDFPGFSKVAWFQIDRDDHMEFVYSVLGLSGPEDIDDISVSIEELLPKLRELGFDGLIIEGETGSEVYGIPIETVKL